MKMYLTRKYIGVKIITILGICAITFAITSCNSKQTVITTDNATSASQASTANKPIMSDPETTQIHIIRLQIITIPHYALSII